MVARVKMRRVSDILKVTQLSMTDLWLEPGVFHHSAATQDWFKGWSIRLLGPMSAADATALE